LVLRPEKNT